MGRNMLLQDKKGISVMIGYILLVSAVLAMSVLIFSWMKSYVPNDPLECPDGVSVYLDSISYENNVLSFTLKNNGRFDVGGYYIHATTGEEQKIATKDLTEGEGMSFASSVDAKNFLIVDSDSVLQTFNLDEEIVEIEILPFRYQDTENGKRKVTCNGAKVREVV